MSIKIVFLSEEEGELGKGLFCPMFICDVCGESIKDARHAAAVFNMTAKEALRIDVEHVHKGRCMDIAEGRIGSGFGWEELNQHIKFLQENSTPKKK